MKKIQVEQNDIINLFKYYLNDEEIDDDDDEQLNKMIHVKWFLKFYNVYVNNVDDNVGNVNEDGDDISTHILRIKIEQKSELELDFDEEAKKFNGNKPIFEIFLSMIKSLFLVMFSDLKLRTNTFKILQEIVVEFVKNVEEEEEDKIFEFEDIYDTVLTDECVEYRTIKVIKLSIRLMSLAAIGHYDV